MPTIDKPTRVHNDSYSLIDNIFISNLEDYITSGNIISDLTDHFSQFYFLHSDKTIFKHNYVGCVSRPSNNFGPVSSSLYSHMVISHVPLLVTEGEPCWPRLLLGWVTFSEISIVSFFPSRLFPFYSRILSHHSSSF